MKYLRSPFILGLVALTLSALAIPSDDDAQNELAETYKSSYGKMLEDSPEKGRDAILALLPTEEELTGLLGPNTELIWPEREKYRTALDQYYKKISTQLKQYGTIQEVAVEKSLGSPVDLLKKKVLFPKNIPVYGIRVNFERQSVRLGPFARVNNRWVFLPEMTDLVMSPTYSERHPDKTGFTGPLSEQNRALLVGTWKSEDGQYSTIVKFSPLGSFNGSRVLQGKEVGRFRGEWFLESSELRQAYLEETPPTPGRPAITFSTVIQLSKETMRLQSSNQVMNSYLRVSNTQ